MKESTIIRNIRWIALFAGIFNLGCSSPLGALEGKPPKVTVSAKSSTIPRSEIGFKTSSDYKNNGLSVVATAAGAQLRCVFQKLDGEATSHGLWLTSSSSQEAKDRFNIIARALGRANEDGQPRVALAETGQVTIAGSVVRFHRQNLIEEYSVSIDGVRQDFLITRKPGGSGELRIQLDVTGAAVEQTSCGVRLVLENSQRRIAYSRLHVEDATGQELPARLEIISEEYAGIPSSFSGKNRLSARLAVLVDDEEAVYPVRVDPTFSDENWISMGAPMGANNTVRATAMDESGNLYIGGDFTLIGDVSANRVAMWDGTNWSALGSGVSGGSLSAVHKMVVLGGDLYVAGDFTVAGGISANYVAKWNGVNWSPLGPGVNGPAYAMAASGSNIYLGGPIGIVSGGGDSIAKWDGSNWSALGWAILGTGIRALAASNDVLYAGGGFSRISNSVNGVAVNLNCVAKWDENGWSPLGSGVNNVVRSLVMAGNSLYAAGLFTNAGEVVANRVAKWDGSNWSPVGDGITDGTVMSLVVSGESVCVAGDFTQAGDVQVNRIARWDGNQWTNLGMGLDNLVMDLCVSENGCYAGGAFLTADGKFAHRVARWDGNEWSALSTHSGLGGYLRASALFGSNLYVGVSFTTLGNDQAFVAKWNGNGWSKVGSGMNADIRALASWENDLYVGGLFTKSGSNVVNYVAKWDGSNWSSLGSGLNGAVFALAARNDGLYAGGNFSSAGDVPVTRIARWDGGGWSALGAGMDGAVLAMATFGNSVYAGGQFTKAGGNTANRIAKWDGTNWLALGSGMDSSVWALNIFNNNLYAGGSFANAGGNPANSIAWWNGSNWSPLGTGMNNTVFALTSSEDCLFAGGSFTNAGGILAHRIAKWNGTAWTPLGTGVNSNVTTLAISDNYLYVGGQFTIAGGKISAYAAKADISVFTPPLLRFMHSENQLILFWHSKYSTAILETSPVIGPEADWVPLSTSGASATIPLGASNQFFRLSIP